MKKQEKFKFDLNAHDAERALNLKYAKYDNEYMRKTLINIKKVLDEDSIETYSNFHSLFKKYGLKSDQIKNLILDLYHSYPLIFLNYLTPHVISKSNGDQINLIMNFISLHHSNEFKEHLEKYFILMDTRKKENLMNEINTKIQEIQNQIQPNKDMSSDFKKNLTSNDEYFEGKIMNFDVKTEDKNQLPKNNDNDSGNEDDFLFPDHDDFLLKDETQFENWSYDIFDQRKEELTYEDFINYFERNSTNN